MGRPEGLPIFYRSSGAVPRPPGRVVKSLAVVRRAGSVRGVQGTRQLTCNGAFSHVSAP